MWRKVSYECIRGKEVLVKVITVKYKSLLQTRTHDTHPYRSDTVRMAYLLMVHGRSVRQVLRLFHRLYHPNDYFYIHVDSKSNYMYENLKVLEHNSNVKLAKNRFGTEWGGTSFLTMMTNGMQEMLEMNWQFDFVINVSGTDFLIKKPEAMKKYLSNLMGMNFVFTVEEGGLQYPNSGYNYTFVECDNYVYKIAPRTLPKGIIYKSGSDFLCLSKYFVKYILQKDDPFIHGLYSVFNYTQMAPEKFFQVALRNSKFCTTHINSNIRVVNFAKNKTRGCHCHRPADFCGCSPIIQQMRDLKRIEHVENHDKREERGKEEKGVAH